ncbi:MAG TPA: S41 family peptidase [Anaerolineae bacterium]|nr:S41 family peptidase [Anaerolineae bacterium]
MNADKAPRYILLTILLLIGAALFFVAGLGTGLYVAQSAVLVQLPATTAPTAALSTTSPTPTLPEPTATPAPMPTALPTPTRAVTEDQAKPFDIFWEAWEILRDQFYGELPTESELPYAAIEGVIASTGDPYTAFLDPVRAEIVRTDLSGSFEGIGATVRKRPDGRLEIVQPLPDHPAIEAGLRAADIVLSVDGTDLEGMNIYEAISLIRGPAGTVVRLLVQREGIDEPFEIGVIRARIEVPVVESRMLADDLAYLRLNEFGQTAIEEVEQALRALLDENPRGLILDLRGNPGGYLTTAIEVSSEFVAEGPILIERFRDETERAYDPVAGGLALDIPLVVLVDGGSASASEIVAGAIQDSARGILVGTTTLGKGSVQLVNTLSDGSQLRVTTASWFTPAGRAIHGEGLTPDIEVEVTEADIEADRDPQLERAIEYLREGIAVGTEE